MLKPRVFCPLQVPVGAAGNPACHSPAHPRPTMTGTPSTPRPLGGTPSPPTTLGGTRSQGDTLRGRGTHSQGGIRHRGGTLIRAWPCPPCPCGLVSGANLLGLFGGGHWKQGCCEGLHG